eukprot:scaffold27647_cov110-Isochrysis_galbana.AAC.3
MARTCLEAAGTRFGQEPARARRSLRRRGNTAHTQSSCGARSGARATRALHRALNPVAPPSLPTWGKCRHMVGQCRASVRVLRLVLWLHRLCELGVGARGRVGPDGLVGGVGGRHKHRVLLGHLGIPEGGGGVRTTAAAGDKSARVRRDGWRWGGMGWGMDMGG